MTPSTPISLSAPIAAPAPRKAARLRSTRLCLDALSAADRAALAPRLHALFLASYGGLSLAEFSALLLEHDGVRVGLFHDGDELVGCTICRVLTVEMPDETVNVFTAAVYFRHDRAGGSAAARWGLKEALRVKLRQPWRRLGYLSMAHTPAPYALFNRVMPRVYPSERCGPPPARDAALMREALSVRGWAPGRGSPWVLRSPFRPIDDRWVDDTRLARSPHTRSFVEQCPDWAQGDALAVWMPLEPIDVLTALRRVLR